MWRLLTRGARYPLHGHGVSLLEIRQVRVPRQHTDDDLPSSAPPLLPRVSSAESILTPAPTPSSKAQIAPQAKAMQVTQKAKSPALAAHASLIGAKPQPPAEEAPPTEDSVVSDASDVDTAEDDMACILQCF